MFICLKILNFINQKELMINQENYIKVANIQEVKEAGYLIVQPQGQPIALFHHNNLIYAIDNRCPHMGFPLHQGTVSDCILTCHWHHARFDLNSGGTFDPWADDVRAFPVEIREDEIWLNLSQFEDNNTYQVQRLQEGLEQNISLVIAKSVIALLATNTNTKEPFRIGLNFGVHYRKEGWGAGLTIHTCMMNLLPYLEPEDKPHALYHGLAAVANDCRGKAPKFIQKPLSNSTANPDTLQRWFRQFIEVRDGIGAERCLVSAIASGVSREEIASMLFTAATDHRYLDIGHVLDFTNKALSALDATEWENAAAVLSSLVISYAQAERMEESNSWRYPLDLVAILESAFETLESVLSTGKNKRGTWNNEEQLLSVLLGDNPAAIANSLLQALADGCTEIQLAGVVVHAAALRLAQFHTNNDFRDWDTAHHSFTFANAVHQGLTRVSSKLLLRGVFDAAMTVYLNRFLNIPPSPLPSSTEMVENPELLLLELPDLLDRQQQVNEVGRLVAKYLYSGGNPDKLLALMGKLLLRENRDFHTIQAVEAAFTQYSRLRDTKAGIQILIAAARYLAAHSPYYALSRTDLSHSTKVA